MIFPLPDLCCLPRDLPQSLRMPCRLFFTVDQLRHLQQPGETDWPTSTILGKKLSRISEVKPSFLVFALSPGCTWAALLLWLSYTPSWPGSLTYWLIWWETQWLPEAGWPQLRLPKPPWSITWSPNSTYPWHRPAQACSSDPLCVYDSYREPERKQECSTLEKLLSTLKPF